MIEKQNISNQDSNWAKQYDYYETIFRENYNVISKPQNDSHFEMVKSHLKNYLNKDLIFAEIGFGSGLTLRHAANYFKKVYGLDISPKNVDFTNKELRDEGYTNIKCMTFDIMKLNEDFKNKFDVITFIHGLEHFSETDYPILFANIKYYLTANGVFTGALPNDLPFTYRMCPKCNEVFEIDGHLSRHTKASLEKLFGENNFEIMHLNDFNIIYYIKNKGLIKTLYHLLRKKLLSKKINYQLEFIVKPIKV